MLRTTSIDKPVTHGLTFSFLIDVRLAITGVAQPGGGGGGGGGRSGFGRTNLNTELKKMASSLVKFEHSWVNM